MMSANFQWRFDAPDSVAYATELSKVGIFIVRLNAWA